MQATLILQKKALSWNKLYAGMHWSQRSKLADEWHELVFYECKIQKIPKFLDIYVRIISTLKKPLDADNICAKIIIDGLVLAGIIKDDTPRYVKAVTLISKKGNEELTKVEINGRTN